MLYSFQQRVASWLYRCFGAEIARDITERNHRFLEESLELVQSKGGTAGEAHELVDYVFSRPTGEPRQEVGGVMVTLAALCDASSIDMAESAEIELDRISKPNIMAIIREKQKSKPAFSPLPGIYPDRALSAPAFERAQQLRRRLYALENILRRYPEGWAEYSTQGYKPIQLDEHWLSFALERVRAGEPEKNVLLDYGYDERIIPSTII